MKKQLAILVCLSLFFTHCVTIQPEISRMQRLKLRLSHEFDEFMKCVKSDQNCDKNREKMYIITSGLLILLGAYLFSMREVAKENRRIAEARQQQESQHLQQELFGKITTPRNRLKKQVVKKWKNIGRLAINLSNELNPDLFTPDRQEEVVAIRKEINDKPELQTYFDPTIYYISGRSDFQAKNDLQQAIAVEKFLKEKQEQIRRLRLGN